MGADLSVEWTRNLGGDRLLVMERVAAGYRASLVGFRGVGSSQELALDDLLACMQDHISVSADFTRSPSPGGALDTKLVQLGQLVDQCVDQSVTTALLLCPHCVAGDPSVWDDVFSHYAHPTGDQLKFCHEPWRERCLRCSGTVGACACTAAQCVAQEPSA